MQRPSSHSDSLDGTVGRRVNRAPLVVGMNEGAAQVRAALHHRGERYAVVRQGHRITAVVDRATLDRLLAARPRGLVLVRDAVHPGLHCVRPETAAATAARLMRATGSGALPVVDERHRLVGLLTLSALDEQDGRQ
ncbi:MAG TPA: CBS domain-containing protein [Pseudonocardiaceae bacterium]